MMIYMRNIQTGTINYDIVCKLQLKLTNTSK